MDPESKPFTQLPDTWNKNNQNYNCCRIPISKRPISTSNKAKVIVCHDMAGGYLEDRLIQGSNENNVYSMQHWSLVDIFIYFSHARITIPPVNWTISAHKNGVQMLGTFITENEDGHEENLKLLYGPDYKKKGDFELKFCPFYADMFVEMAIYYGFDGWFINIEAPMDKKHVPNLIQFLNYLTQKMHKIMPESLIIWYDSLTINGDIAWQDQLNLLNKPFFDVTDGIFINYTWKENYPRNSSILAGDRKNDVFTGIDCWGRNSYGGGGFNAHKALRNIQNYTSVALFAPAWTFEFFNKLDFQNIDKRFWIYFQINVALPISKGIPSTFPDLNDLGCISNYITPRPVGCINSFYTNFCCGFGSNYYINGAKVSSKSWSYLARQSISCNELKSYQCHSDVEIYLDEIAYNGGHSLAIQSVALTELESINIPLFHTDLNLLNTHTLEMTLMMENLSYVFGLYIEYEDGALYLISPIKKEKEWQTVSFNVANIGIQKVKIQRIGICVLYNNFDFVTIHKTKWSNSKKLNIRKEISKSLIGRIGQISIKNSQNTPSKNSIQFQIHKLQYGKICLEINWKNSIGIERWEILLDNIWTGTSFSNSFRLQLHEAVKFCNITVESYDHFGKMVETTMQKYEIS